MNTEIADKHEDFQGSKFPSLAILYPDEFEQLHDDVSCLSVKADEVVIREGQSGEALYLVKSGQLRVNKRHDDNVYEVGAITSGDIFGEASVLYHGVSGAEVRAVDDCELYVVSSETVHKLFQHNDRFLRAITQLAERRVAASALAVNPAFSTLPLAVRETALYNAKFLSVKPGEVIIHEGDESVYMFVILSGEVDVSLHHPTQLGEQIEIVRRVSGDELGEIAVITGHPHGATIRAVNPVRLLALKNISIAAWSERYSDFAYSLYGQVFRKLKENRQILAGVIDDKFARKLTVDKMPSFDIFKAKYKL